MLRISYSSTSTFRECPRKYHYRYRMGRVPTTDADVLRLGKAVHQALEHWWEDGPEAARGFLLTNADIITPVEAAKVSAMLEHYNPPRDEYEVIATEKRFELALPDPFGDERSDSVMQLGEAVLWRGYADSVLLDKRSGKTVVRECKTTSEEIIGFGPFWSRIAIDAQTALYKLAFGADGIVYDVLRKPMHRVSQADSKGTDNELDAIANYRERVSGIIAAAPEEWFQWRPLWRDADDIRDAHIDLWQTTRKILWSEKHDAFEKHDNACRSFYGICPYLDVCAGRASLDDEALFMDREERTA